MGRRYGVCLGDSLADDLEEIRRRYPTLRTALLENPPSGDAMCIAYRRIIQRLLAIRS